MAVFGEKNNNKSSFDMAFESSSLSRSTIYPTRSVGLTSFGVFLSLSILSIPSQAVHPRRTVSASRLSAAGSRAANATLAK